MFVGNIGNNFIQLWRLEESEMVQINEEDITL